MQFKVYTTRIQQYFDDAGSVIRRGWLVVRASFPVAHSAERVVQVVALWAGPASFRGFLIVLAS